MACALVCLTGSTGQREERRLRCCLAGPAVRFSVGIGPPGPLLSVHRHDRTGGFGRRGAPRPRILLPQQPPGVVTLRAVHDRAALPRNRTHHTLDQSSA